MTAARIAEIRRYVLLEVEAPANQALFNELLTTLESFGSALTIYADKKNWNCPRCGKQDRLNCFMGRWIGPVKSVEDGDGQGWDVAEAALESRALPSTDLTPSVSAKPKDGATAQTEGARMNPHEIVERIMTQHWDLAACRCWICKAGREFGLHPRDIYLNWRGSFGLVKVEPSTRTTHADPRTTAIQTCKHERLNEDGICRTCGQDARGI